MKKYYFYITLLTFLLTTACNHSHFNSQKYTDLKGLKPIKKTTEKQETASVSHLPYKTSLRGTLELERIKDHYHDSTQTASHLFHKSITLKSDKSVQQSELKVNKLKKKLPRRFMRVSRQKDPDPENNIRNLKVSAIVSGILTLFFGFAALLYWSLYFSSEDDGGCVSAFTDAIFYTTAIILTVLGSVFLLVFVISLLVYIKEKKRL